MQILLNVTNETVEKLATSEADGKCPDARLPKSRGMKRTYKYAAVTRDEGNAADGRFPTASLVTLLHIQFTVGRR
jgi:hypothetical protein